MILPQLIINNADNTKSLIFDISGNTTAIQGKFATTFTNAKTLTFPDITDTVVTKNTTDTMTNKTITDTTNVVTANFLRTTTTPVGLASSAAPTAGMTLVAISPVNASWQKLVGTTIFTTAFSGPFAVTVAVNINVNFSGNMVSMNMPSVTGNANGSGGVISTTGQLPVSLRPAISVTNSSGFGTGSGASTALIYTEITASGFIISDFNTPSGSFGTRGTGIGWGTGFTLNWNLN